MEYGRNFAIGIIGIIIFLVILAIVGVIFLSQIIDII